MRELDCPNCGAHLGAFEAGSQISCSYCGTRFATEAPKQRSRKHRKKAKPDDRASGESSGDAAEIPSPSAGRDVRGARSPAQWAALVARGAVRWTWRLAWMGLSLIGVTLVVALIYSGIRAANPSLPEFPGKRLALEAMAKVGLPPTHWDQSFQAPIFVEIDGRPAVVNRMRAGGLGLGAEFFAEAYALDGGERLWRIGPIDDGERNDNAHVHVHVHVLGDEVFVTDPHATLRVYGLEDGEFRREFGLREHVVDICTPEADDPDAPALVWLGMADEEDLILDPGTMTTSEAASRPAWCVASRRGLRKPRAKRAQPQAKAAKQPKSKDTWYGEFDVRDDLAVARGQKRRGTRIPQLAGYDPTTGETRWEVDIPAIDLGQVREDEAPLGRLFGELYVTIYGVGRDDWRITAFDAATGTRVWDQPLRTLDMMNAVDDLGPATEGFLFIERGRTLEIRRLTDGEEVASIGGPLLGP